MYPPPAKKRGFVSYFMKLPEEVKVEILVKLRTNQLAVVACVCKEMHDLSRDSFLWETKMGLPLKSSLQFMPNPRYSRKIQQCPSIKSIELPRELKLENTSPRQEGVVFGVWNWPKPPTEEELRSMDAKMYTILNWENHQIPGHLLKSKPKEISDSSLTQDRPSRLMELPRELKMEILGNLLPKYLTLVASVCKEFKDLTVDPHFWYTKMYPMICWLAKYNLPDDVTEYLRLLELEMAKDKRSRT